MDRPLLCTPSGTCCGQVSCSDGLVTIGSTLPHNDGSAQLPQAQFLTALGSPDNPFPFLDGREWADMREHSAAALELAQAAPGSWVITTEVGVNMASERVLVG